MSQMHNTSLHESSSPSRALINELPSELLALIFTFLVNSSPCLISSPDKSTTTLDILRVCKDWYRVAASTACLWSHIDVDILLWSADQNLERTQLWLERCRDTPIHVHVQFSDGGSESQANHNFADKLMSIFQPRIALVWSLMIDGVQAAPIAQGFLHLKSKCSVSSSYRAFVAANLSLNVIGCREDDDDDDDVEMLPWRAGSLNGLIELDLSDLYNHVCPTLDSVITILLGSPALHTLRLRNLGFPRKSPDIQFPIPLPQLRLLDLGLDSRAYLSLIDRLEPGTLELDVRLKLLRPREKVIKVFQSLLSRTSVVSLLVILPRYESLLAKLLAFTPQLRVLLLNNFNHNLNLPDELAGLINLGANTAPYLPDLHSLCLFDALIYSKLLYQLEKVLETREIRRLVFLSCKFSPSVEEGLHRKYGGPADRYFGPVYPFQFTKQIPSDMHEWVPERVGRLMVRVDAAPNDLYHGVDLFVQELMEVD